MKLRWTASADLVSLLSQMASHLMAGLDLPE
jgi:hypothetical protein